jgi:hypothetical protein
MLTAKKASTFSPPYLRDADNDLDVSDYAPEEEPCEQIRHAEYKVGSVRYGYDGPMHHQERNDDDDKHDLFPNAHTMTHILFHLHTLPPFCQNENNFLTTNIPCDSNEFHHVAFIDVMESPRSP